MNHPTQRIGAGRRLPALSFALLATAATGSTDAQEPRQPLSEREWEELVVVASHVPRPAREVGSAITVLDAEDIDLRKVVLGSELLRVGPGVSVNRTGGVGNLTQVRIRGAEGNHTLVLIDGIEANDPALGSEFNFADLQTWGVDRIEVLRGPQSALYGSDAIGGVVSVSTPTPDPGFTARGQVEAGSFGTSQIGGTVSGGSQRLDGLLSAHRYDTDGISSSAIEPEHDGYESTTVHGKLEADVSERVAARVVLRHVDNAVETDRQDFDFPDTPTQGLVVDADGETRSSQRYVLAEVRARLHADRWLHRLAYAHTDTESDAYSDDVFTNGTRGERRKLEYETSLLLHDDGVGHVLTGGIQREALEFENVVVSFPGADQSRNDEQTSYVVEYAVGLRGVSSVSMSVRHDDNDLFEDATTYRATGSHLFEHTRTRMHASYGEGITNPGFFELFGFVPDSFVGNPDLEPEKSAGWDVGIEQALFDGRARVDLTYFHATLEDEIVTVFLPSFDSTAQNEPGESDRRGLELTAEAEVGGSWSIRGTYTYLDATDPDGSDEIRRPRHSGSIDVNRVFLGGRGNVNVGALFNGEQEDAEFVSASPETRATLDRYTLLNVALSFDLTDRVQIFARGENLLDEDYSEVFGYRSPGAAGYLGVRARL